MKKITSLALALIITVITAMTSTTFACDTQLGDVDSDGTINSLDASYVLQYYALSAVDKTDEATNIIEDVSIADVDADGNISALDASYILLYYADCSVGKTPSWPSSSNTTTVLKDDQYAYIGTGVVELKSSPNDSTKTVDILPIGEKFTVSEVIDEEWIKISIPKCPVEMYLNISNIAEELELFYRPLEITIGQNWTFNGISWNVRSGTSTAAPSVGRFLSTGDVITVLEIHPNNWVKICDGEYVQIDRAQFSVVE